MYLTLLLVNGCSITATMERNKFGNGWRIGEEGSIPDFKVSEVRLPTTTEPEWVAL